MSFIKYFTKDRHPVLKIVEVEREVTQIKLQHTFVGRNQEVKVLREKINALDESTDKITLLKEYTSVIEGKRTNRLVLPENNISIDLDYYNLTELLIMDEKKITIKVKERIYEK